MSRLLMPHQLRVVSRMAAGSRGLLVVHSMGSGKTFTACEVARRLLAKGEVMHVIVLAPKTVVDNWVAEAKLAGLHKALRKGNLRVVTPTKWLNDFTDGDEVLHPKTLIVVDEAHNMRTRITNKKSDRRCRANQFLNACASPNVTRVMLLTGTPVVNEEGDLVNLALALQGVRWSPDVKYNTGVLDRMPWLKDRIDHHEHLRTVGNRMPRVIEEVLKIVMTTVYYDFYVTVEANQLNAMGDGRDNYNIFMNGLRRIVNGSPGHVNILSPKLVWLAEYLNNVVIRDEQKSAIFTNWMEYGVDMLVDLLNSLHIEFVVIDGHKDTSSRQDAVDAYNANRVKVIVFTSAACEGTNLIGTEHLIVMEPHWNMTKIDQIVGRAARVNSHTHLPPDRQVVHVKHLILVKPALGLGEEHTHPSIDSHLLDLSNKKRTHFTTTILPQIQACQAAWNVDVIDLTMD